MGVLMSILNHLKKSLFIYLIAFLGISHFAYAGGEISAHFGKKFQTDGAWHFGADALYRISIDENSSFGIGTRYRFFFKSKTNSDSSQSISLRDTIMFGEALHKHKKHRVALLVNYRFEMMESIFIGTIAGIDIWKYLNTDGRLNISSTDTIEATNGITSSEFLWDNFTAQIGIEVGYKVTPNFLIKLESGYDLLSFKKKCFVKRIGSTVKQEIKCDIKFNGVYATIGVGVHF